MPIGGKGKELNVKVHKEQIAKTERIYFAWQHKWSWLIPEIRKLQEDLAQTNLKQVKVSDKRTIKPIPETVNHEYGWLVTKNEFRLAKLGPDQFDFPLKNPEDDDD